MAQNTGTATTHPADGSTLSRITFAEWLTHWRFTHGYLSRSEYLACLRLHPEWGGK